MTAQRRGHDLLNSKHPLMLDIVPCVFSSMPKTVLLEPRTYAWPWHWRRTPWSRSLSRLSSNVSQRFPTTGDLQGRWQRTIGPTSGVANRQEQERRDDIIAHGTTDATR
nr:hypothetical protein CFP56_11336 [Quercus suber]